MSPAAHHTMQRRLAHLGVALLLVGAVALAAPTFGFSTIAADRGTAVQTAEDPNALLGFEPTTEQISGRQDLATAFYLRNNADQTLTLSVTNTLSTTDVRIADDGSGTIAPGDATRVVVECNGGGSSGTATITTEVTDASGATVSILGASSSTTFDYQCTGGGGTGPASFVAGDVQSDGTQTLTFDGSALGNKDTVTIDLTDAHGDLVDYSGSSVSVNASTRSTSFQDGVLEVQAQGNWQGTIEVTVSGATVLAEGSATATYADDRGRSDSDTFAIPPP